MPSQADTLPHYDDGDPALGDRPTIAISANEKTALQAGRTVGGE